MRINLARTNEWDAIAMPKEVLTDKVIKHKAKQRNDTDHWHERSKEESEPHSPDYVSIFKGNA